MTPHDSTSRRGPVKGRAWVNALLRYGIPLAVSVGLCWMLLTEVDFAENLHIAARYCRWQWIAAALALSVVSHLIRAARWGIQLRALDIDAPYIYLVYSIFGTYAVNLVLPRLGEIWRTGYIANRQRASFTKVFGSMVADRLADALTVLLIVVLTACVAFGTLADYVASEPGRAEWLRSTLGNGWLWTCVGLVLIGGWLIATRIPSTRLTRWLGRMWRSMWDGFVVIGRMRGRGLWLLLTLALWVCYFMQLYLAFYAFEFTAQIASSSHGLTAVLVCFSLSTIGMMLPSNGGIGPWQLAIAFGLSFYSAGVAVPAGYTFHTMSIVFANCVMTCQTILLIALGLLTFAGISLDRSRSKSKTAP